MTRREFLKNMFRLIMGGAVIYISRMFGLFLNDKSDSRARRHAKFYSQADDLAG